MPGAELYFMNPVKSRVAIARAYHDRGVKSFAFDSDDELDKIMEETGKAKGPLTSFCVWPVPDTHSLIPLEGKFGVSSADAPALLLRARQLAQRLGITFHVGSQAVVPAAFGDALRQVGQLIVASGVLVDAIDIGGGFPSRYPHSTSARPRFLHGGGGQGGRRARGQAFLRASVRARPGARGGGGVAIVRVDARRDHALYINDGAFGTLFDAAYSSFRFPARLIGAPARKRGAEAEFSLYGPTCDSSDYMPGPFVLPELVTEGDYLEIGQIAPMPASWRIVLTASANMRRLSSRDAPLLSMYGALSGEAVAETAQERGRREARA